MPPYIEPLIAIVFLLLCWLIISLTVRFIYATEGYLEQFLHDDHFGWHHLIALPLWLVFKTLTIALAFLAIVIGGLAAQSLAKDARDWWHKGSK